MLPFVHAPTGNWTRNLGMCADQELNLQPFSLWDNTQPVKPYQPGLKEIFKQKNKNKNKIIKVNLLTSFSNIYLSIYIYIYTHTIYIYSNSIYFIYTIWNHIYMVSIAFLLNLLILPIPGILHSSLISASGMLQRPYLRCSLANNLVSTG